MPRRFLALPLVLASCSLLTPTEQSVPFVMEAPTVKVASPDEALLGQPAPNFTLVDQDGNMVSLEDFRGYPVVLEWFDPTCPTVRDMHINGPVEGMSQDCGTSGVQFLAINSCASGTPGCELTANQEAHDLWNMSYPILFDTNGDIGHAYNARRAPQMFVIDAEGILVYRGAMDNAPGGVVRKGEDGYRNYVDEALAAIELDREVDFWKTRPYGCPVDYDIE